MKKISNFNSFNEGVSKISTYLSNILRRGGKLASDVWDAAKVEGEETKIAIDILSRMIKGEEVSDKEKKFLKAQSGDIIRILPLVAISGIPIPIPITPLLIMLGKKYGFDFLPKDNRHILKNDVELPDKIKLMLSEIPETGMGYHSVDLFLNDGEILKNRIIINSSKLKLRPEENIDINRIESISPSM